MSFSKIERKAIIKGEYKIYEQFVDYLNTMWTNNEEDVGVAVNLFGILTWFSRASYDHKMTYKEFKKIFEQSIEDLEELGYYKAFTRKWLSR